MTQSPYISLPELSVLELSGNDAQAFLQSQVPSDIRLLDLEHAQISGWCSAKGRLLATFIIWPTESGYSLLVSSDLRDAIAKRLKMYVMRLKVQVMAVNDHVYGLLNPANALGGLPLPTAAWHVTHNTTQTAIGLPNDRVLLIQNADTVSTVALPSENTPLHDAWERASIAAGLPWVSLATTEQYVPQMIHLDKLGGVSFKKGCYPGQEIVARTHYLGKIKRHLYRVSATAPLTTGAPIYAARLNGQACGSLVLVAPAETGPQWLGLAVLQQDAIEGALFLQTETGEPLVLTLINPVWPEEA